MVPPISCRRETSSSVSQLLFFFVTTTILSNSWSAGILAVEASSPSSSITSLQGQRTQQCGTSKTFCKVVNDDNNISPCCHAQYSPTGFGCRDDQGYDYCCTPGPALEASTTTKNCLVIGDSVSIGYTPIAADLLRRQGNNITCQLQHGPFDVSNGGAGNTTYGKACLDNFLTSQRQTPIHWDVIVFNFGLHNLVPTTAKAKALYKRELTEIAQRLSNVMLTRTTRRGQDNTTTTTTTTTTAQRRTTKLVYATTTPFMPAALQNNTIVEDLNAIARHVMTKTPGVAVDLIVDLYKVITDHCGSLYENCDWCRKEPCNLHYNKQGSTALAKQVANAIEEALDME